MLRRSFLVSCGAAPLLGSAGGRTPAGPGSWAYALASGPDGRVYLVWTETVGESHSLRISRLEGDVWARPRTIARGADDWFVNTLDHPAVAAGPDGRVMVNWLVRPKAARKAKYGYGLRMAFSADFGRNWKQVFESGADNIEDYSGFVGFSAGDRGVQAAYLSPLAVGLAQPDAAHLKTLRFAEFNRDGRNLSDQRLDADVCSCCPLATAQTSNGPVVVYRDHEPGEIRDISIVRRVSGAWTKPRPVHRDGWKINGCPGNGAAIQADGRRVAVAWYTMARDEPRVLLALSNDAGKTFADPLRIDAGSPVGWAGVAILADGRTAVSWLEKRADGQGAGEVLLRIVGRDGQTDEPIAIAEAKAGRSTGIPQMVRSGSRLVFAWRSEERVRTTVLNEGLDGQYS